ncbi:MAG: hypothetical protein KME47_19710 [Nodosilinea sp. WJT8-NPBG4]|jgi:hypothetical protein|nr:hypothetical protein [Nodosilinea sp. WJT8-NPBG4]
MKYFVAMGLAAATLLALSTIAKAEPTQTCQFDPELGLPNPLGMQSYLTITEEDGSTTFLFEQFPTNLGNGQVQAAIASNRILTFYETGLDDARQLMLQNPSYYSELVGYSDSEGFGPINAVLSCSP